MSSSIERKFPADRGLNSRHDCDVEATDAEDFTVSTVRFPRRLLEVDKAEMRRIWRLFSRYLRLMKLPDISTTATSIARPIHQELDRHVAEAKLLCYEKLKHNDISPEDPAPLIEFIQRLAKLAEITGQETLPSPRSYNYSIEGDPQELEVSIRLHLQDCWTRNYATSNERAVLHARDIHVQRAGNQGEVQRILSRSGTCRSKFSMSV